jgi:hypothetical protein
MRAISLVVGGLILGVLSISVAGQDVQEPAKRRVHPQLAAQELRAAVRATIGEARFGGVWIDDHPLRNARCRLLWQGCLSAGVAVSGGGFARDFSGFPVALRVSDRARGRVRDRSAHRQRMTMRAGERPRVPASLPLSPDAKSNRLGRPVR